MIVRLHGAGQYRLDEGATADLDRIDDDIIAAVNARDLDAAHAALGRAAAFVRKQGTQLPEDDLSPSDLVLPDTDATLDELESEIASLVHPGA